MTARYRANASWHDAFLNNLAGVLAIRGKLAEADRALASLAEARSGRGEAGSALDAELMRVIPVALYREDQRAAKAALDAVLRTHPLERMSEPDRPMASLIRARVSVGDQEAASRLLDEFGRNHGNIPGRVWEFVMLEMRGEVVAMRKESLPEAIAAFRKAAVICSYCVDPPMALAFERAGQADSALVYFQRWADTGENFWEAGIYFHWPPLAYFRLGELYEAKGDKTKAVDFYGRFTELWREADPELQPRVKEARRRIAALLPDR
jgi:tetratricopeptide (TPR) repeat protein